MPVHKGIKIAAQNRKARHDYFIEDTYECGIALQGTEVKSIRKGALNLKDSGVKVVVGSVAHPMTEEHHIVWIEVFNGAWLNRKYLRPGDAPEAEFYVPYKPGLVVRAYCNLHGLWQTAVK